MKATRTRRTTVHTLLLAAMASLTTAGCVQFYRPGWFSTVGSVPAPQGALTDPIWIAQEENAEPSKFVLYQHEFVYNTARFNWAGEDHIKQIAARLHAGQNYPVLIERSTTSKVAGTEYKYPVNPSPELDMQRRAVTVQVLLAMGIPDAEQRVVVSPALVRGQEDLEAERSYGRSFGYGGGMGGFGGGFGGFGGGVGGFGGGGGFGS
jgi:uncharacterized membrane protein YgcG